MKVLALIFLCCLTFITQALDREEKFTNIYQNNLFWNALAPKETVSGPGSTINKTSKLRKKIESLFVKLKIKTFIDAPCGDFNWMRFVNYGLIEKYIGVDIVKEIIEQNQQYKANNITFIHGDIVNEILPKADLILCRDCLVHLSFTEILQLITKFRKSGSTFVLFTTFPKTKINRDISEQIVCPWRPLNLQLPPFNFPKPLKIIREESEAGKFQDKSLGLWRLSDIVI